MAKSEKPYALGDRVLFTPAKGSVREGSVRVDRGTILLVHLDGDPFAVDIAKDQCVPCKVIRNVVSSQSSTTRRRRSDMPTATAARVSAKELRKQAQGLGVEGYESMGRDELAEAIEAHGNSNGSAEAEKPRRGRTRKAAAAPVEAEETTEEAPAPRRRATKAAATKASKRTRKAAAEPADEAPEPRKRATRPAPAKSARKATKAAPAAEVDPNVNPFRKGSNLHVIVPLLVKGGKRATLATKLAAKVDLHHYSAGDDAPSGPSDYDKRITLCASTLRDKHGWTMIQEGRGMSGWLQVVPPGGELPNRPNARVSTKA